jgi:hypothetical protein
MREIWRKREAKEITQKEWMKVKHKGEENDLRQV